MPQTTALKSTAPTAKAERKKIKFCLISDSSTALHSQILSIFQSFDVTALTLDSSLACE
jgi:hypothetical protein